MRLYLAIAIGCLLALAGWAGIVLKTESIEITDPPDGVGGLSGLVVSAGGQSFTAIGDRNVVVRGILERMDGVLTGARVTSTGRLRDWKGRPYIGAWNDAEGLAITRDGQLVVSFETQHRVVQFDDDLKGTLLPPIPPLGNLEPNQGFEALALDPQGRPVMIVERPDRLPDYTMVFRLEDGDWRRIANLAYAGRFLPTGADFGPDGSLYVLERRVGVTGFRSQIRRVTLRDGGTMTGEVVWQPQSGFGNLEGLSVWQDAQGVLRATMVADDNELRLLPGGFTEIILAKPGEAE